MRRVFAVLLASVLFAVAANAAAPVSGYKVVATYPHSTSSYTEGFFYLDGFFYEGTGQLGSSGIQVDLPMTGRPIRSVSLPPSYFGEGIVNWGPNIYQWTWTTHTGFIFDRATLHLLRQFTYTGEGWGMTHNSTQIITSDGTATIRFRDPATFKVDRSITVRDAGHAITNLNELEYIKGEIYANVWQTDRIARISPRDGHVIGWIDLTGLIRDDQRVNSESVLNGIAYDAQHDRLFVTGKQWPYIFEIKIVPRAAK